MGTADEAAGGIERKDLLLLRQFDPHSQRRIRQLVKQRVRDNEPKIAPLSVVYGSRCNVEQIV